MCTDCIPRMQISPIIKEERPENDAVVANALPCHKQGSHGHLHKTKNVCDACPFCSDTCNNPFCSSCAKKRSRGNKNIRGTHSGESLYTMCQLRRHNHLESAWLLVGKTIYDATPYISAHPGGVKSIIRKSGGQADCTEDMGFHSKKAIKLWKKNKVGLLCRCPGEDGDVETELYENPCIVS
mmetsp:Transcript_69/g.74  ORF Transcript_69/g.74 Transcript_69/m.74 type:complete len:182 (+) Transcript_69:182-727(+)